MEPALYWLKGFRFVPVKKNTNLMAGSHEFYLQKHIKNYQLYAYAHCRHCRRYWARNNTSRRDILSNPFFCTFEIPPQTLGRHSHIARRALSQIEAGLLWRNACDRVSFPVVLIFSCPSVLALYPVTDTGHFVDMNERMWPRLALIHKSTFVYTGRYRLMAWRFAVMKTQYQQWQSWIYARRKDETGAHQGRRLDDCLVERKWCQWRYGYGWVQSLQAADAHTQGQLYFTNCSLAGSVDNGGWTRWTGCT